MRKIEKDGPKRAKQVPRSKPVPKKLFVPELKATPKPEPTPKSKPGRPGRNAVPYNRKPQELSLEEWQVALRKQFVETRSFGIENLGRDAVFSDYRVINPENGNSYKVALRDNHHSMNFCSCMDFKTNRLGTCKHIEAVIRMIETKPRLKKLYLREHKPEYTSVYLSYKGDRKVMLRIGEAKKSEFGELGRAYFTTKFELKEGAIPQFEKFLLEAGKTDPSFRCYPDAMEYILKIRDQRKRTALISKNWLPYLDNGKFDSLLKTKLFKYQKQGVCFAVTAGRTLIADDMGLGKTIQAIAAAELMKREMNLGSVLVCCPTSLKYQWKTEIEKFTDNTVKIIEGNALFRKEQYQGDEFYKIVSYHALVNDLQQISDYAPDLIILDEAQRIKNFKTKVARSVKKINSPYAIVLTGTPLENKLEELYSIIQFVDPFMLGPFYRFLAEHQITDDGGKVTGYKGLNQIGEVLSGIMIRRKKKEVLDQLPERLDKLLLMTVTPEQARLHEEFANSASRICAKWRKLGFLSEQDRQRLLILLNQMRMVCDSTYLIDQKSRDDTKVEEVLNIITEVINEGSEKLVIFSQWERMTRLVARELEARSIGFEYLHGGVPSGERGKLFENFTHKADSRVFLSTDAGGVGLNLQAGSVIINLDIPWNPAVLEQRIARVHRLGQKRNVTVINMVSAGTIEHRMLDVLKFKSSMASGVLDGGEDAIFMGESRFKKFMMTVDELVKDENSEKEGSEKGGSEVARLRGSEMEEEEEDDFIGDMGDGEGITGDEGDGKVISGDQGADKGNSGDRDRVVNTPPLLQKGMEFLTELAAVLSKPDSLKQLTDSLVVKDQTDGRTYVKIPVESREVVERFLGMIAGRRIN